MQLDIGELCEDHFKTANNPFPGYFVEKVKEAEDAEVAEVAEANPEVNTTRRDASSNINTAPSFCISNLQSQTFADALELSWFDRFLNFFP